MYCSLILLRRNCFLCTQCPKISVLLFNDGLDMRMESFSCRHSLHIFSPGAYGFTFFIISHLMLKSVFFFFNFQMWSLRVEVVLLCSSLNDDLCRLNLVLNSFSVSPIRFLLLRISFGHRCFVDDTFGETLPVEWAIVFLPTVAQFVILG